MSHDCACQHKILICMAFHELIVSEVLFEFKSSLLLFIWDLQSVQMKTGEEGEQGGKITNENKRDGER